MAYRDFIRHPSPAKRKRWGIAGCSELGRLAQGFEDSDAVAKVEEAISAYESRSDLIPSSPRIAIDLEMLRNALRALRAAPAP